MAGKLIQDSEVAQQMLVTQLYDEWRGHYMLRQFICGEWCDVRPLSRDEAMIYRCQPDEGLEIVYAQAR